MTTLATDTMIRANQSGLGTASDGVNVWAAITNSATANIVNNEASISNCISGFPSIFLGSQTTADINILVRIQQVNSTLDGFGPCFRCIDANNMYFIALYSGDNGLLFAKLTSGSYSFIQAGNFTFSTGVYYWIRTVMSGNHLQARVWQDGNSEPSTWTIDTTDTTYTTAGQFGMSCNTFQTSSDTVLFDHITVTDNSTSSTRTIQSSAVLQSTLSRTLTSSGVLSATLKRTIGMSATLTFGPIQAANLTCFVRSGAIDVAVRSGAATCYVRE